MVTVEKVLPPTRISESPYWDNEEQVLYFPECKEGKVHKYNPATKTETVAKVDGGNVSIIIPIKDKKNKFLITINRDIAIMTWDGVTTKPSHIERIATVDDEVGKRDNKLNDGKADCTGRLWIGTMGLFDPSTGEFASDKGSLFSLSKDRKITTHLTGITLSNGMAWSPDNKTMYYTDSRTYKVDAFDFDAEKGQIANRRTVFDVKANGLEGGPDGMTIDTDGNLWIALAMAGKVINVDPKTGKLLKAIEIPSPFVTCVIFGGKNLDELYVTSGIIPKAEEQLTANPLAGCVFRVTGTGAKGFPCQPVDV